MTAKEFIDNWQKVLAIYKETAITNNPKITAGKIIEEIGKENALTVKWLIAVMDIICLLKGLTTFIQHTSVR